MVLGCALALLAGVEARAANIASFQTGNWNVGATWVGGTPPGAGDNATIASSHTVTLTADAAAATITVAANTAGTNGIVINPGMTLAVGGAVTMNLPTANSSTIDVGAGTLTAASIAIPGSGTANRFATVTVSTGTVTTTGSITFSGSPARARFISTGASMVNVAGNFGSGGTLTTSGTGTINFNGGAAQTMGNYTTYNNVLISNTSGGVSHTGATTIGGTLTIASGTLTVAGFTFSATGATSVSGTLLISSVTAVKTFGSITVNDGGLINFTAAENITCNGNLQVDGTGAITGTQGTWAFQVAGGGGTLSGTAPSTTLTQATFTTSYTVTGAWVVGTTLTVTGAAVAVTNNGTLTASTALSGTGALVQAAGALLRIGGTSGVTTLTAVANPNTVEFYGAAQTVKAVTYHHLTLGGSGAKTLTNVGTVNGDIALSGTCTATTAIALTVGGNLTVGSGTTFTVAGFALTVTGATSVTGTLAHSSVTAVKTHVGQVTINSGGSWTNAGNSAITFRGGLSHGGTTFTSGTGVYTFDANDQSIGGSSALSINNVTVTGIALTNNSTSFTVTTALSGTGGLTQGSGATLNIGGTSGITTLTATVSPNTVQYSGAAQTVKPVSYHHLTLAGSGVKTMPGSVLAVGGDFTMSGTASATAGAAINTAGSFTIGSTASFTTGAFTDNIKGSFSNSGTFVATGSTISLTGTVDQSVGGTATTTFRNLTVSKSSGTVNVATTFNVGATLTLSGGTITTGANRVVITPTGSVSRTSGHVVGNLEKNVATGSNVARSFEVGDAVNYSPVDLIFSTVSVSGELTASATAGDHPSIAGSDILSAHSVNRYWTVSKDVNLAFTNYIATFNFTAGDVDAGSNTGAFEVRRYSGGSWSNLTAGARNPTSTQVTGSTGTGDFQIGDVPSVAVSNTVFAFGTQPLNTWLAPDSSVITNDGTDPEAILAKISALVEGANTWALSASANGPDQVRAQWSTSTAAGPWTDVPAYDTNFTVAASLAASGTVKFYLRIQTPTSTSSLNPYSSTLTVLAQ